MRELPGQYINEMKALLGDEFDAYMSSLQQPSCHGLRVNTSKISVEDFIKRFPYHLERVPWTHNGFYYDPEDPVTKHPYYYAGLYYVQEPSAMLPGEVMPVSEGDYILDACAAPGGKSTELGVKLHDTGVLVSNDVSASRAQALLKNIERFGIGRCFVTAEDPEKLERYFPHAFNRILIDAPCSGEGMFRRDPSLISAWEKRGSSYYVPIQKRIMKQCIGMLKEGGTIVYSTCTFSRCEDEEIIEYALSLDPELKPVSIPFHAGFVQNEYGTRLYPHRIQGEGHFVSVLQKGICQKNVDVSKKQDIYEADHLRLILHNGTFQTIGDKYYYVPSFMDDLHGLRILRSGLLIGEEKKKRLEYDQALAFHMHENECDNVIQLSSNDARVQKYMRGETIDISDKSCSDGWCLVCAEEFPLGFAKISHGVFKNKIGHGWIQR